MIYAIDFEYRSCAAHVLQLVCCCISDNTTITKYWLYDGSDRDRLRSDLKAIRDKGGILLAHAVEKAEGTCLCQLGLKAGRWAWLDTFLIEKLLVNSNLLQHKKVVGVTEDGEEIKESDYAYWAANLNLLSCLKRHGIHHDLESEDKDRIRRIIIDDMDIEGHKDEILDYCASDICDLFQLFDAQFKEYEQKVKDAIKLYPAELYNDPMTDLINLSRTAAIYSEISHRGLPVNISVFEDLLQYAGQLVDKHKLEFNKKYPIYEVGKKGKVSRKKELLEKIIESQGINWPKTASGSYSVKDDVLDDLEGTCPFAGELKQHLKLLSDFKNFSKPRTNPESFGYSFDGYRTHPDMHMCSTQTGRCAPAVKTGFIPASAKVLRPLISPNEPGKVIVGLDYSSEENALQACWSGDEKMKAAYMNSDYYIGVCIQMGVVPPTATKKTHAKERKQFKPMILGMGYGMGYTTLYNRNKETYKNAYEAKMAVDLYKSTFKKCFETRDALKDKIEAGRKRGTFLLLPGGLLYTAISKNWGFHTAMGRFGVRTVNSYLNFPIQGAGAMILYELVRKCYDNDIALIGTIHDEVLFECKKEEAEAKAKLVQQLMKDAAKTITGCDYLRVGDPEINDGSRYCIHDNDPILEERWLSILNELDQMKHNAQI